MAEVLAQLKKTGGKLTEKVLWTNNSPTSNFSSSDITLSDAVTNYKYIDFEYRYSTSNNTLRRVRYSPDELILYTNANSSWGRASSPMVKDGSGIIRVRGIVARSSTVFSIASCDTYGAPSSPNATLCIPTRVIGLK